MSSIDETSRTGATHVLQLVKIAEASSGIDPIDALPGRIVQILSSDVDIDPEPWLEVWVDRERVLVYERDLELISMA